MHLDYMRFRHDFQTCGIDLFTLFCLTRGLVSALSINSDLISGMETGTIQQAFVSKDQMATFIEDMALLRCNRRIRSRIRSALHYVRTRSILVHAIHAQEKPDAAVIVPDSSIAFDPCCTWPSSYKRNSACTFSPWR